MTISSRHGAARRGRLAWAALAASLGLAALVPPIAAAAQGQNGSRIVQCRVESAGRLAMSGPCSFTAEPDGSFSLAHAGGDQPLFGKILSVSVSLVAPGRAEVRGLTQDGINSRWGAARRSKSDRACWDGDDFRVCAY